MQRKTAARLVGFTIMCGTLPPVSAEIFSCKDATGKTITADRQIPECFDRTIRVYGANGVFKREIAPPLTEVQKQAKQLEEQRQRQEKAALLEQRQADRAILLLYQNEQDIESAQNREISQLRERIAFDQGRIVIAETQWELAMAEARRRQGQPTDLLRFKIESSERAVQDGRKSIARHEADIAAVNTKYDRTLKRFRELAAAGTASAAGAGKDGEGKGGEGNSASVIRAGLPVK